MNTVTRIKKISPLQLGKVLAVIYGLVSLIIVPFLLVFGALGAFAGGQSSGGFGFGALGAGLGIVLALVFPVMYAFFGFVAGLLGALIYNLVAKWVGGIEVEFEA